MQPIEYIRKRIFGISQVALALIAETTQATVSRWESGAQEPSRAEMARIRAHAGEIGVDWNDSWFFEVPVETSTAAE